MREVKGVFYFKNKDSAERWALSNGWPTGFIRSFEKGFAVQACDCGRYAGSNQINYPGSDWMNPI